MKKLILYVIILCLGTATALSFNPNQNEENINFLENFGWEVDSLPLETVHFTLPDTFDAVYEGYNELQLEAGLDLTPYLGKSGKRYTYRVLNYPLNTDDEIRANLLVVSGVPIAGDICTVRLNGFMHSLKMSGK